jgi:hypothetical protein
MRTLSLLAVLTACTHHRNPNPHKPGDLGLVPVGGSSDLGGHLGAAPDLSVLAPGTDLAHGAADLAHGAADLAHGAADLAHAVTDSGHPSQNVDLCMGLVTDKAAHAMTTLAKPALGQTAVDPQFGTTMRRITAVSTTGANAAVVPMYSTISAWNADESLLILYDVASGNHNLYDGKTYQPMRTLDINPPDLEQVYWDTGNPDLLYYLDGQKYTRYHVSTGVKDRLHDFTTLCGSSGPSNGSDPMFTSWDSHRLGITCGSKMFVYDSSSDTVLGNIATSGTPPVQVAPSGTLGYLEAGTGQVFNISNLTLARSLTLQGPNNHSSLGRLANGHDTWNGAVYDDGNDDASSNVGILVTWDLTNGTGGAVIGPKTGFPYPPDGHISAMAYRQPGWVYVSTFGNTSGAGLLDMENLIADTNTGTVCRVGRHRSWGKSNSVIGYWAEAHTVPSPTGTRAVFASDWGGGSSVDSYVLELPSYHP